MKIYSLNPISIKQEDSKMNYTIPAVVSPGMYHDSAIKISQAPKELFENTVNNMVKAEAIYQKRVSDENNLYSRNVNFEKEQDISNPTPNELIKDHQDVREYVEDGSATIYEAAGSDSDDLCYELPFKDKKLYIYTKCMHSAGMHNAGMHSAGMHNAGMHSAGMHMTGGLVVPEESNNEQEGGVISNNSMTSVGGACKKSCGACKKNDAKGVANTAQGVANSAQGVANSAQGVAFNNKDLDDVINNLSSSGGAIPAIIGELALNLIPQIPSIISAIKAKRDQSKIGNGLLNNMQKYNTVRAFMNNLPEGNPAVYYNDMIKTFNALKRTASGISFNESDNSYYATGKFTQGLKNFWNKVKSWYDDNKTVFAPIKDALLGTVTNTINKSVNTATNKLTDYVNSKTSNEDIKNITKAVTDVSKNIAQQGIDMIKGNGIEPEKVYSVLT